MTLLNYYRKKKIYIIQPIKYNTVIRRNVMRATVNIATRNYILKNSTLVAKKEQYHLRAMRIAKDKKVLGPKIASDDTGVHPQVFKVTCDKTACEKSKCSSVCGNIVKVETKFHGTHKPVAGKFVQHASDIDANGKKQPQYVSRNCDKSKQMTAKEYQDNINNESLKPDAKFEAFMQNHSNKFDD